MSRLASSIEFKVSAVIIGAICIYRESISTVVSPFLKMFLEKLDAMITEYPLLYFLVMFVYFMLFPAGVFLLGWLIVRIADYLERQDQSHNNQTDCGEEITSAGSPPEYYAERECDRRAGLDHSRLPSNTPSIDYGREHDAIMSDDPLKWLYDRGWLPGTNTHNVQDPAHLCYLDLRTAVTFQLVAEQSRGTY